MHFFAIDSNTFMHHGDLEELDLQTLEGMEAFQDLLVKFLKVPIERQGVYINICNTVVSVINQTGAQVIPVTSIGRGRFRDAVQGDLPNIQIRDDIYFNLPVLKNALVLVMILKHWFGGKLSEPHAKELAFSVAYSLLHILAASNRSFWTPTVRAFADEWKMVRNTKSMKLETKHVRTFTMEYMKFDASGFLQRVIRAILSLESGKEENDRRVPFAFIPFPIDMFSDNELRILELRIYHPTSSRETIASLAGLSLATVNRAMRRFTSTRLVHKVITTHIGSTGGRSVYILFRSDDSDSALNSLTSKFPTILSLIRIQEFDDYLLLNTIVGKREDLMKWKDEFDGKHLEVVWVLEELEDEKWLIDRPSLYSKKGWRRLSYRPKVGNVITVEPRKLSWTPEKRKVQLDLLKNPLIEEQPWHSTKRSTFYRYYKELLTEGVIMMNYVSTANPQLMYEIGVVPTDLGSYQKAMENFLYIFPYCSATYVGDEAEGKGIFTVGVPGNQYHIFQRNIKHHLPGYRGFNYNNTHVRKIGLTRAGRSIRIPTLPKAIM